MAKKIRFPLILKDGYQVKDLEELQSHFDLDRILDYYQKGQLQQWLQDRYYETEYAQIMELDPSSPRLSEEICSVLGVEGIGRAKEKRAGQAEEVLQAEKKKQDDLRQREQEEAERKARQEMERKAWEEAERKAREEAERKAREEMERKAKEEAERRMREEIERKVREEMEEKARREAAERKIREDAERRTREEQERKARVEAEHKIREDLERKAREEAERKAHEEAEQRTGDIGQTTARKDHSPVREAAKPQREKPSYLAIISLVCSFLSWATIPSGFLPIPLAIAGIVLGVKGRKSKKKKTSIAGIIISSLLIVFYAVVIILVIVAASSGTADTVETTDSLQTVESVIEESETGRLSEPGNTGTVIQNKKETEVNGEEPLSITETYESEKEGQNQTEESQADVTEPAWTADDSERNQSEESSSTALEDWLQNQEQLEDDYLLPESDRVSMMGYTITDRLDQDEMQLAVYEIYARHGMIFEDPTAASYFSGKSWYVGEVPEAEFDYSVLNEAELDNIETIENIIKYRD